LIYIGLNSFLAKKLFYSKTTQIPAKLPNNLKAAKTPIFSRFYG